MEHTHIIHITSLDDLRNNAGAWDDLWWRSGTELPTARAELLVQWVEQFRPRCHFHALVVSRAGQWIAALPLISCRIGWLMSAGGMPGNSWSPCGDFLCDMAVEAETAAELLMSAAAQLPWQLLWINEVLPETKRWQAVLRTCDRYHIPASYHERYRVGRVEIGEDWKSYQKCLPKNHRQAMSRAGRKMECEGDVRFEMDSRMEIAAVEPWLAEAFDVEDFGWKGMNGSSVLRTPGMFRFFANQAKQLARWGHLETASIRLDGRMVAFVYGFRAKGVYFAHKIGYDPRFAQFSPGQFLFHNIIERLHEDDQIDAMDFVGPLNHSLSRWRPKTYAVGRIVMAPRGIAGRAAIFAYRNIWRRIRQPKQATIPNSPATDSEKPPVLNPAGAAG